MLLRVKPKREYVLGGKVYKSGELVEVPDKQAKLLLHYKSPLEKPDERRAADLPKAAYKTKVVKAEEAQPEPAPLAPAPETEPAEENTPRFRRTYRRRDLTAEE